MTLDSLAGDAAWLGRYARNGAGEVLPWAVIEEKLRSTQPFEAFMCVCLGVGVCGFWGGLPAALGHAGQPAGPLRPRHRGRRVAAPRALPCWRRPRSAAHAEPSWPTHSWGPSTPRRVRSMLSVPYFEKALYELPEEEVTPQRILELADEVEARIEGGPAPRPLMRCVLECGGAASAGFAFLWVVACEYSGGAGPLQSVCLQQKPCAGATTAPLPQRAPHSERRVFCLLSCAGWVGAGEDLGAAFAGPACLPAWVQVLRPGAPRPCPALRPAAEPHPHPPHRRLRAG